MSKIVTKLLGSIKRNRTQGETFNREELEDKEYVQGVTSLKYNDVGSRAQRVFALEGWHRENIGESAERVLIIHAGFDGEVARYAEDVLVFYGIIRGDRPLYGAKNVKAFMPSVEEGIVEGIESGFVILGKGDYKYIADGNKNVAVYVARPHAVLAEKGEDMKNVFYVDENTMYALRLISYDILHGIIGSFSDVEPPKTPKEFDELYETLSMAMDYLICRVDEEAVPLEEVLGKGKR